MLNLCKGHVFVELNYPHIIGISGYERHHDVARMTSRVTSRQTCTNRARSRRRDFRANNGERKGKPAIRAAKPVKARGLNAGSRRPYRRSHRCGEDKPCRPRLAAGASVESAVLRRPRHANRRRWYVVLHGHADRAAGAGAAVLDHPQARGRQALSRDPGREGRHPSRRRAVPGGRDAEGSRTIAAGCCASAPMSTTGCHAMPDTACDSRWPPTAG